MTSDSDSEVTSSGFLPSEGSSRGGRAGRFAQCAARARFIDGNNKAVRRCCGIDERKFKDEDEDGGDENGTVEDSEVGDGDG